MENKTQQILADIASKAKTMSKLGLLDDKTKEQTILSKATETAGTVVTNENNTAVDAAFLLAGEIPDALKNLDYFGALIPDKERPLQPFDAIVAFVKTCLIEISEHPGIKDFSTYVFDDFLLYVQDIRAKIQSGYYSHFITTNHPFVAGVFIIRKDLSNYSSKKQISVQLRIFQFLIDNEKNVFLKSITDTSFYFS